MHPAIRVRLYARSPGGVYTCAAGRVLGFIKSLQDKEKCCTSSACKDGLRRLLAPCLIHMPCLHIECVYVLFDCV